MTLRLRLTLLYGVCFLVAGAGLLAITYALFSHSTGGGVEIKAGPPVALSSQLPAYGFFINAGPGGSGAAHGSGTSVKTRTAPQVSGPSATRSVPLPDSATHRPGQLLAEIQHYYAQQVRALNKNANFRAIDVTRRANVRLHAVSTNDKASLLLWSGVALGGMAVLSILLGWLMAGRALRPLRTMNQRAREITEESLHQRLGVEQRSDELGDLAATFDALLERLERAFDAQRRFVANASHELRTPLTLERTLVEVALADPDASVESLRRACQRVLVSGAQQERVIDALLTLARGQAGIDACEQVDMAELAEGLLAARATATAALTVDATLEPAVVDGDCALLERLVANLIDNAIAHNLADGGWITIETRVEAGQPLLRVVNSGPPVPPDRLDELFEPFRRLEGERVGQGRGLGLGLSIVRAIALAHGAELQATARPEGGLELDLRFRATGPGVAGRARAASADDDRQLAGRVGVSL
jgi:signal transduction histidine kinase